MIVHPTSLSATLDATAEAYFYQNNLSSILRQEIANQIISRQSQTGMNAGYFIPYTAESDSKVQLFSGEGLSTNLARIHIPLIEAVRLLMLLAVDTPAISQSIKLASHRMEKMCYSSFCAKGECKALTIAYLRYMSLDGIGNSTPSIHTHLINLKDHRDGKGKWGGFPFFYTLLLLTETDDPIALQELTYAAPVCEKQLAQNWLSDPVSMRRQEILSRALARS